jgi:hypothetical protein
LATGDSAFDGCARGAQISIEVAFSQRLEARLVVHIVAASHENNQCQHA